MEGRLALGAESDYEEVRHLKIVIYQNDHSNIDCFMHKETLIMISMMV